jgi:hypothetical protein
MTKKKALAYMWRDINNRDNRSQNRRNSCRGIKNRRRRRRLHHHIVR